MATDTTKPPGRPRLLSRARLPDILMAVFLLILAAAIFVNAFADVRDTRRTRLDKKVAVAWFRAHPQLGKFSPPIIKVHKRQDIACAPRATPTGGKPVDGYCIWIDSRTIKSKAILRSHRCIVHRKGAVRPNGTPWCPAAHA